MKRFYTFILLFNCFAANVEANESPFQSEEIAFKSAGDVSLSGSLTLPNTQGPHPAIVMIGGAERMDRRPMYRWADAESFVSQGIAVFCFDSPGTGKSEGNRWRRTHKERTEDVLAAIRAIAKREDINGDLVGLYGASEGGVVVFRAASRLKRIAFGIAIAAPTAPDYQGINLTVESLATDFGLQGVEIEKLVTFNHLVSDLVRNYSTINHVELEKKVAEWNDPGWSQLRSLVQKRTDRNREATKESFITLAQKWNEEEWFRGIKMLLEFWKQVATRLEMDLADLGVDSDEQSEDDIVRIYVNLFSAGAKQIGPDPSRDEDPVSFLKEIECPMLCIYGERDPLARGTGIIRKVFADTRHNDFVVKIFPGAGHQLKVTEGERSYRHKDVDKFILNWVRKRVQKD